MTDIVDELKSVPTQRELCWRAATEIELLRMVLRATVHPEQGAVIPPGWIAHRDELLGKR